MSVHEELRRRAEEYVQRNSMTLAEPLGAGVHGIVYAAESQPEKVRLALKVHEHEPAYARERDVYLRLKEHGVTVLRGCRVPRLLHYDDELWALAMGLVTRPFVLDFAGAYLDDPPDFSEEVLADWHAEKQEQFGPRWPEVQAILRALEAYGVYQLDVNPGNVSFDDGGRPTPS
jgi:hypothetical protein